MIARSVRGNCARASAAGDQVKRGEDVDARLSGGRHVHMSHTYSRMLVGEIKDHLQQTASTSFTVDSSDGR